MIPDTKSLILASLSLGYSLHRRLPLFQNRPFSLQRHKSPPQSSLSPRLLEESCLRETLVARGLGRAPPCLQHVCQPLRHHTVFSRKHCPPTPFHTILSQFTTEDPWCLGCCLDTWMVVRCWALKSILRERKKQGRLTSDSDRKSSSE